MSDKVSLRPTFIGLFFLANMKSDNESDGLVVVPTGGDPFYREMDRHAPPPTPERIRLYRREMAWQEAGRVSMYPDSCWMCEHFRIDCTLPPRMFCSGCGELGVTTRQCHPPSSLPGPSHRHRRRAEVSICSVCCFKHHTVNRSKVKL